MPVKIGIFLCDCGGSLKNIDFPKISGNLEKLEDVAFGAFGHGLAPLGRVVHLLLSARPSTRRSRLADCSISPLGWSG